MMPYVAAYVGGKYLVLECRAGWSAYERFAEATSSSDANRIASVLNAQAENER